MRKKLTDMTIKECEAEIASNEEKRSGIIKKEITPAQEKCNRLYNRSKKLADQIASIKISRKRIDWDYVLSIPRPESSEHYKYAMVKLRSIGLMNSGYYPDINQTAVRVALIKGDEKSYKQHLKGLKKILPYIKPRNVDILRKINPHSHDIENLKGIKCIDIFDRGLSEHETWVLQIDEEKGLYTIQPTRHRYSEGVQFDNLEDAQKTKESLENFAFSVLSIRNAFESLPRLGDTEMNR